MYERVRREMNTHIRYFESGDMVSVGGGEVEGLNLPAPVLEKLYVSNARAWYPGL